LRAIWRYMTKISKETGTWKNKDGKSYNASLPQQPRILVCGYHHPVYFPPPKTLSTSRQTASVTPSVSADPPISFVLVSGLLVVFSMACINLSATSSSLPSPNHLLRKASQPDAPLIQLMIVTA
jgi:hypothetical protein